MKKIINQLLRRFGYEIQKSGKDQSLLRVLSHAKKMDFGPKTVIDVGAAWGGWSRSCATVFPDARYVLVEPLVEYRASLEGVVKELRSAVLVSSVAASAPGTVTFHVHPDLEGSSVYREGDDAQVNGVARELPATTIDAIAQEHHVEGPCLLKLDVQGAELEVLRGAEETLEKTEYVILETSLFSAYDNVPLLHEVIAFMAERGFVPYDILGLLYRPLDGALCQADVCFVKENGMFRKERAYRKSVD
ncbi:MAG: FkbM family methyltransferase [Candidatus Magasanikbacteria bacterium]|nr:FkbM family methyltransferase [Candidatus Magasanikbacteria bacterium]